MTTPAADLLDSFLFDTWDALSGFEKGIARLRERFSDADLRSLSVTSHRIKGTAALYGYPQISKLAELSERLLESLKALPETEHTHLLGFLEQVDTCLRTALERVAAGQEEGDLGLELAQLGGSKALMTLLRQNPKGFIRPLTPLSTPAPLPAPIPAAASGLARTLRHFYAANNDSWDYFAPEAREHLEAMRTTLDTLEDASPEAVSSLFRATHTLKGSAFMVGFDRMGEVAHRLEDLMVNVREGDRVLNAELIGVLNEGVETLERMLRVAESETDERQDRELMQHYEALEHKLEALNPSESPAAGTAAADSLNSNLRAFVAQNGEVWGYFAPEARSYLQEFSTLLEDARKGSLTQKEYHNLFRTVHTLKGSAQMIGFRLFGDISERLEQLMLAVIEGQQPFGKAVSRSLREGYELLMTLLGAAEGEEAALEGLLNRFQDSLAGVNLSLSLSETHTMPPEPLLPEIIAPEPKAAPIPQGSIRVQLGKLDNLMNLVADIVVSRARLNRELEGVADLNELLQSSRNRMLRVTNDFEEKYLNPRLAERAAQAAEALRLAETRKAGFSEQFTDLEFDTYDDLNILARSVAEMTQDLSTIQTELERLAGTLRLEAVNLQKLTRNLRDGVSRTRMVPVTTLFKRLQRLEKANPERLFRIEVSGESVEVDNLILEELADPLLHLVKNSIFHGIEDSGIREAKGKNPVGKIAVRASYRGQHVYIEVEDDGAGINVHAVREQALKRGLKSEAELSRLKDEEIVNLIFLPGLSTATEVTMDAGRGVGMDVVASNIRRLKGEITVQTERGIGTLFRLMLPLTLIVSEALTVRAGGRLYALPVGSVRALYRVTEAQIVQQEDTFVQLEGDLVRLIDLGALLGLAKTSGQERFVMVLESAGERYALAVDQFLGLEEVVVKALGESLRGLYHLSGASVGSSGEVMLMLDPAGLLQLARQAQAPAPATLNRQAATTGKRHLLLVDDSVSVRQVFSKMLRRAGYEVTTANDGQEALDYLLKRPAVDAVLTDLEMPRVNGFELIEELRRRPYSASLPVFVISTRAREKHMSLAFDLGATDYFSKPVDETQLVKRLERLFYGAGH